MTTNKKLKTKSPRRYTWIRLRSVKDPSYTVLTSPVKLQRLGPPRDPWGKKMVPRDQHA